MFHFQVFLCLDSYNTGAIAINKPCKLNFTVFYNVLSYEFAAGLSGLLLVCYQDFEALVVTFRIS